MNLALLLQMVAEADPDRVAISAEGTTLSYAALRASAAALAQRAEQERAGTVALVDVNSAALPVALFGAAQAGRPFAPLNYRLSDAALGDLLARLDEPLVIVGPDTESRVRSLGVGRVIRREDAVGGRAEAAEPAGDGSEVAILLFTSGTTGTPKEANLRHRHLTSYVISTVEFLGASPDEAALVSVPPYHVAAIAAALTATYAGRRIAYLRQFDAAAWVETASSESATHAMVVPTMLGRIVEQLEGSKESLPRLQHLAYGGGRMPVPVVEAAIRALPHVDFVNAYGLTETSSTISVLDAEDHRRALSADDPAVRARLGSVGRPLPSVEVTIRGDDREVLPAGESGEIWVRGAQVAGEYAGHSALDGDGWFHTNDGGRFDEAGYLFLEGRLDDVIVRGGENISPVEVEDVLLGHVAIADAGVLGVPDHQWGEDIVAAVVLEPGRRCTEQELQDWVRAHLRSSRVPGRVHFVDALPYNDTGKLVRRALRLSVGQEPPGRTRPPMA